MVVNLLSPEGYKQHMGSCLRGKPQQVSAAVLSRPVFKRLVLS